MDQIFFDQEAPLELQAKWHDAGLKEISVGRSSDRVFQLNGNVAYIKVSAVGRLDSLTQEKRRLDWLATVGIAIPIVLGWHVYNDRAWLEMSAIQGTNAFESDLNPIAKVELIAQALRDLHETKVNTCPFNELVENKLKRAAQNVERGLVDEQDFDADHLGISATLLLQRAYAMHQDLDEDIVVTHGDACMPNIILNADVFSGFVDCGKLGLADRYQDLALAARSIKWNLGEEFVQKFFDAYGLPEPDQKKLYFYRLLDEFF
jgi:aminoglycoside 3'-phosphotransferase II